MMLRAWAIQWLALTCVCAAPALAQDPAPERSFPDGIVAIVDGQPIMRRELELGANLRGDFRAASPDQRLQILRAELDDLIEQTVLLRRAKVEGLTFTEDDQKRLDLELERRARDYRGLEGLEQALAKIGVPFDFFRRRQKAHLIIGKLILKHVSRETFVPPAAIRQYYHENEARFWRPGEVRFRKIVVYPDPADASRQPLPEPVTDHVRAGTWDPQAYAEELRGRALNGEPFAALAREGSMSGLFADEEVFDTKTPLAEQMDPTLGAKIDSLRAGEISSVIATQSRSAGTLLNVVLLVDRREPGIVPLEEVQRDIEAVLRDQIWQRKHDLWVAGVRAGAYVEVYLPGGLEALPSAQGRSK